MTRTKVTKAAVVTIIALMMIVGGYAGYRVVFGPHTITAYFTSATALYEGDDVRVAGMQVGTISSIEPQGDRIRLVLRVDRDVKVPADAKAVIVAQSLIAARFVQLTPSYHDGGPTMADGAEIPLERTAIPIEWDDIKDQLQRLADAVGPTAESKTGTLGNFIDSAADAVDGNGRKLKDMLTQLSGSAKILSDESTDLFDTIKNLQIFVDALSGSGEQIVQFEDRLASVSSLIDANRNNLDAALTNLSSAVVNVQRFVAENRQGAPEQLDKLRQVTQILVDNRDSLAQLLHVAPNGLANYNNIYNPATGTAAGAFALNSFANPIQAICSAVGAIQNATAEEGANLCREYLGPVLSTLSLNSLPVPVNPILEPTVPQDRLIYTEPDLIPDSASAQPPGAPPTTSIEDLLAPIGGGR
ncbi:MAG: MCE family protein [Rhodococcus sp. (in: high G+C Gram-positive bacteria)]|uniref:MCE family protein n=1 Tax=Rhodococcus sp. TaxID=1831 RepID=UPI003BAF0B3B